MGVPMEEAVRQWGILQRWLSRALDRNPHQPSLDLVLEEVKAKRAQVWVLADEDQRLLGAGVTKIVHEDGLWILRLMLYAGDLPEDEMLNALNELEAWGMLHKVDKFQVLGRRGWVKKLPGFKEAYTAVERDLRRLN